MQSAAEAKQQGNALFAAQHFAQAIEKYSQGCALAQETGDIETNIACHSNMIMAYIKLQQYQEALQCGNDTLTLIPSSGHALQAKVQYRTLTSIMALLNNNPTDFEALTAQAKSLVNSIDRAKLDVASQSQLQRWSMQLSTGKISLQQQQQQPNFVSQTADIDFAALQKLASQRQQAGAPSSAPTKPQGVWARGGGAALSKQVQKESNGAPVVLNAPLNQTEQAIVDLKRSTTAQRIEQMVDEFNAGLAHDDLGYIGQATQQQNQSLMWENHSILPRDYDDAATTDFQTSSGSDSEQKHHETAEKKKAQRETFNKQLLEQQQQRYHQRQQHKQQQLNKQGVIDGSMHPIQPHPMKESICVLFVNNNRLWFVGTPQTPEQQRRYAEQSQHVQKIPIDQEAGDSSSQQGQDYDLANYARFCWKTPQLSAEELDHKSSLLLSHQHETTHDDQQQQQQQQQQLSLSDGIALVLKECLETLDPAVVKNISQLSPSHIVTIDEWTSMTYPRHLRYVVRVDIEFNQDYNYKCGFDNQVTASSDGTQYGILAPFSTQLIQDMTSLPLHDISLASLLDTCSLALPRDDDGADANQSSSFIGTQLDSFSPMTTSLRAELETTFSPLRIVLPSSTRQSSCIPIPAHVNLNPRPLSTILPFSTVQLVTLSCPPNLSTAPPAVLLVQRRHHKPSSRPWSWDLPITHVESADSIAFTATRLLHNLFGIIAKSTSLLKIQRSTASNLQHAAWTTSGGAQFTTLTVIEGKEHRSTQHPRFPMLSTRKTFSSYWPSRTKPAAVQYMWATASDLEMLQSQALITSQTFDMVYNLLTSVDASTLSSSFNHKQSDTSSEEDKQSSTLQFPLGFGGLFSVDVMQLQNESTKQ